MSLHVLVATPFGSNPDSTGTATGGMGVDAGKAQEAWAARVEIARQSGHPEDIQVLAGEAPSAALHASAQALADEILRHRPPDKSPDKAFLFSGHMIDAPDRPLPRFPPDKENLAAARIGEALDTLGAGPNDLAIAQGAAGGDILFGEACLARGVRLQLLLPLREPEFIAASVLPCSDGESWRQRYLALRARLALPPRIMPDALGPLPPDQSGKPTDPYERCNRWLLYSALAQGLDRLRFICLWNGGGGGGAGGTAHMVKEVTRRTGQVTWLDTRELW
jgi:hypothetical protein